MNINEQTDTSPPHHQLLQNPLQDQSRHPYHEPSLLTGMYPRCFQFQQWGIFQNPDFPRLSPVHNPHNLQMVYIHLWHRKPCLNMP